MKVDVVKQTLLPEQARLMGRYAQICPPGDVADKLSILLLKLENIKDLSNDQRTVLWSQVGAALELLINNFIGACRCNPDLKPASVFSELLEVVDDLCFSNLLQWEHEDAVRLEETAAAARAARKQNNERTKIKNHINQLLGFKKELKQYPNIDEKEKEE